jgi:hypothetical protein
VKNSISEMDMFLAEFLRTSVMECGQDLIQQKLKSSLMDI